MSCFYMAGNFCARSQVFSLDYPWGGRETASKAPMIYDKSRFLYLMLTQHIYNK